MVRARPRFGCWAAMAALAACSSNPLGSDAGSGGPAAPAAPLDYATSPRWGAPATTTIYSGDSHELREIAATCRAEGERTLLYVADDLWESTVTQSEVNGFVHRFEVATRAGDEPEVGVLATNEAAFGELSIDLVPGGKLPMFVIDTEGAGEGYLCGWCERVELHFDGNLLDPLSGDAALSIAAHESFHAIHRGHDADELGWVDESLAQAAMTVNAFFTDQAWLEAFVRQPNVDWGPGSGDVHYGAALLFGSYLWERGGSQLLRAITAEPANGWDGIDAALVSIGISRSARGLFLDTGVAAYLDAPESGFGFFGFDVERPRREGALIAGGSARGTLEPYGLVYYVVAEGVASLTLESAETSIAGRLVEGAAISIAELERGVTLPVSGEGFVVLSADARSDYELVAE